MGSPFSSLKPFSHPAWVKEGYRRSQVAISIEKIVVEGKYVVNKIE